MSLSAAVVRELVAAGVTGDALVTACERIEAADKPVKLTGAERTARWREKRSERQCDVTASHPSPLVPPLSPAPLSPPIIPPTHSSHLSGQALETRLREAAGWQNEPHPNLFVTGCIESLLAAGADLELDVIPVIRGRAPTLRKPSGWSYFVGAIQDAHRARQNASTGPPPKFANGNSQQPKQTLEDLMKETGWKPGTKFASIG